MSKSTCKTMLRLNLVPFILKMSDFVVLFLLETKQICATFQTFYALSYKPSRTFDVKAERCRDIHNAKRIAIFYVFEVNVLYNVIYFPFS